MSILCPERNFSESSSNSLFSNPSLSPARVLKKESGVDDCNNFVEKSTTSKALNQNPSESFSFQQTDNFRVLKVRQAQTVVPYLGSIDSTENKIISLLFNKAMSLGKGNKYKCVDFLFSTINKWLIEKKYPFCDKILQNASSIAESLNNDILLSLLTITLTASDELPSRKEYYAIVSSIFEKRKVENHKSILKGLYEYKPISFGQRKNLQ